MTRGERAVLWLLDAVLWLLDAECRLREVAYSLAPTDERHEAWRAAEAKHCRFLNACVGPEPTDPETRDESVPSPWVTDEEATRIEADLRARIQASITGEGPRVPVGRVVETGVGADGKPWARVECSPGWFRGPFKIREADESMVSHVFGPESER